MKRTATIIMLLVFGLTTLNLLGQAVGDYGSKATGTWGTTGANWIVCTSAGTWAGATDPAPAAPTNAKNVWIRAGHTVTMEASAKTCLNLTVEATGKLYTNQSGSQRYLRVSGTSVVVNGTLGNPAYNTDGMCIEWYNDVTISGSGTIAPNRCRPGSAVANKTLTADCDMTVTYSAIGIYFAQGSDGNAFTVNAGRTVTFSPGATNISLSSSGSSESAVSGTFNINGTLNVNHFNLSVASGKTATLNIGSTGVLNVDGEMRSYTGPTNNFGSSTINIANGGLLRGSGTGGPIALAKATVNVNGTLDLNAWGGTTDTVGAMTVGSTGKLRLKSASSWPDFGGTPVLNSGSTVEYYGSSPITLASTPNSFQGLLINNSAGITLGGDVTVNGTLNLTGGNITTGSNTLTLAGSGSVSRTSGHVVGNFKKNFDAGSNVSQTFEIGDATNYAPVSVTFANVSGAGQLTAKTTAGDHPNLLSSGINSSKSVNRYWTLTNTGTTFDTYDATFNFVAGDVDGGANTASFVAQRYDGVWNNLTEGTKTSTSTQITGVSAFSDFAIGEEATTDPTIALTGTLTNFGLVAVGTTSGEQSYSVAGLNLTTDITITPPSGVEISLGSGVSFVATNPITLTQTGGSVSSTPIYVRVAPSVTGVMSVNISHTSTGAISQNQAVAATAMGAEVTTQASAVTFSAVTGSSMTVSWTNGDGEGRLVIARAGSAIVTNPSDATTYTADAAYGAGSPIGSGFVVYDGTGSSVNVTGLTDGTAYYYAVYEYNGGSGLQNYRTADPATGARGANVVVSTGSGNWSSTSTWVGGILPTSADNVKLSAGAIVTVDDANAECKNISFVSSSPRLAFGSAGVLSIYGDFNIFSSSSVNIGTWAVGGKLKFTGPAAVQTIVNLNTSKTSTSQSPFYEIQVDKSAGKVTTQVVADADNTLLLVRSLEIISGTFELGSVDDIQGWDLATSTTPTITVQSGGTFNMVGGASHIRTGTSGTGQIGNIIVFGEFKVTCTSTNGIAVGNIDVESGGVFTVNSGWNGSNRFNCNAVTVKSGGTWKCLSTSNYWGASATLALNSGGVFESTGSTTTVFPATFANNGTIRYYRSSSDQAIPDMDYNNLQISNGGFAKTWALGADRTISGNLILDAGASLVLSSTGNLNVNGTIIFTDGTVTTGTNKVVLGTSGSVSRTLGYVIGNFAKNVPTGATTLTYELGSSAGYSPVVLSFGNVGTADYVTASATGATHPNATTPANTLQRYWTVTPGGSLAFDSYNATFTYLAADFNTGVVEATDEATLVVGKYNGANWSFPTIGTRTPGADADGGSIQVTGLTSFSDFGIGKDIESLPVELTSFMADAKDRTVTIKWETATEKNSAAFEVERSVSGTWEKVASLKAAGNSNSNRNYIFTDSKLQAGTYQYRLKMIDNDGSFAYSKMVEATIELPKQYVLMQNYPNPFNPSTRIEFQLPQEASVSLEVYGITGEKVATLFKGTKEAGYHSFDVSGQSLGLQSGVYFYRLDARDGSNGGFVQTRKMILTK